MEILVVEEVLVNPHTWHSPNFASFNASLLSKTSYCQLIQTNKKRLRMQKTPKRGSQLKAWRLLKGHLNPSESEFFRWIQKMYSLLKGCLNPSEKFRFRWIQKMYSWPKGHLNPSESEFIQFQMDSKNVYLSKKVTWIHLTLKFLHGYRKEIFSFETTGKMLEGSTDHVFYWMITWIPYSFKCPDWFREKNMTHSIHL